MFNFENPSRKIQEYNFSTELKQNICSPICTSLKENEHIISFQVIFTFTHLGLFGSPFYLNEILSGDSDETHSILASKNIHFYDST